MAKPLAVTLLIVNGIYLMAGTVDPSAGAGVAAPVGSIFMRANGTTWLKEDVADTAWIDIRREFTDTLDGIVPASGGGDENFMRADQIWAPPLQSSPGWFAYGADGAVIAPAGTTTLGRNFYYTDFTVPNGAIIKGNNFGIYCSGTLTVEAGGTINVDGLNASGSSSGNGGATSTGTVGQGGGNGASGGTGAGNNAANQLAGRQPPPFGTSTGQAGNGGAGSIGAGGTGGLGSTTYGSAAAGNVWPLPYFTNGRPSHDSTLVLTGGAGGGGGGGNGVAAGGGGAGGGGVLVIAARRIINNGSISSNGGNGGAGPGVDRGGGGGGGGGKVFYTYATFTGALPTASGGAGGASGGGGGVAGQAGMDGLAIGLQA